MSLLRIVAADGIKGSGLQRLKEEFGEESVVVRGKYSEDELCADIKDMDALLVRSATTVTKKAIEGAGPRLKLIGRAGVGTDNIDKPAATTHGVIVMNTPSGNTIAAAELAIALLFATARHISRADALMQQGLWEKKALVGGELSGRTLGILGYGRIGSHVARVMKAAGMTVIASDPFLTESTAKAEGVEKADLDALLARSDFLTIHTPLTDDTRNLLDTENLAKMKKGARIVNCARGGIVNEEALAEAVKSGHLAAAGVDVYSKEPMTSGPLFGVPGITVDTHFGRLARRFGWTTQEDPEKVEADVAALFPKSEWTMLSHRVVFHGRRVCHSRKPACGACGIAPLCPSYGEGETDPEKAKKLLKYELGGQPGQRLNPPAGFPGRPAPPLGAPAS